MKHFVFAAVLVLLVVTSGTQAQVLNPLNGHYYLAVDTTGFSFDQARTAASEAGGYLVAINDPAEQAFLKRHFANTGNSFWIGLSDAVTEGVWVWDSGEPVTYANWCPNEPNNAGNEDAVEFSNFFFPGGWNDISVLADPYNPTMAIVEFNPVIDPVTKHAYVLTPFENFFGCRAAAHGFGGHLVTINSASENDLVAGLVPGDFVWTGLTDEAIEGQFVWDNGEPVSYTNWNSFQPDALNPGQDYMNSYYGSWYDDLPGFIQRGVVEIPFALAIEPYNGPGSIMIKNFFGKPGNLYANAITLAPGAFPNGWLFGVDIPVYQLVSELSQGPPFYGLLNGSGTATFTMPSGVPAGIPIYAVGIEFDIATGLPRNASRVVSLVTP